MENNRIKYLMKNTAIFTIANMASKFISFFLIPIYTNVLSTAEFGTIDLVTTITTVLLPILTLNVMESVMRFNLDENADKEKISKIGIAMLIFSAIIGVIIIPILREIEVTSGYEKYIYFYLISLAASQIFLCDLRGKEQLVSYSFGNVLNTILCALFNILFLVQFNLGIKGYLFAYGMSNSIVAVYAFFIGKGYKSISTKIDFKIMFQMLKYSIVLIPNSFMWWIMNSSDHIMVTSMIGVAANGVYSISYKLPTPISTITGIFNQAWSYSAIKEEGTKDEEEYSNQIFIHMTAFSMIVGIVMLALIKPFLKVYVSDDYFESWHYTPFLIVGCVYLTLATFMSTSYTVHKDSMGFLLSGILGAIVNIVLNYVLINPLKIYGAAIATCISYVVVFFFRIRNTRKYIHYNIANREFVLGSVMLVISSILIYLDILLCQVIQLLMIGIYAFYIRELWIPLMNKTVNLVRIMRNR